LLDANGNKLGISSIGDATGNFTDIFVPSINKVVTLSENGIGNIRTAYYKSSDCSGTPYTSFWTSGSATNPNEFLEFGFNYNRVLSLGIGKYYAVDQTVPPAANTFASELIPPPQAQTFQCVTKVINPTFDDVGGDGLTRPLVPVTLPFSEPIATPYQFKYE
jgi:hypothetical protein